MKPIADIVLNIEEGGRDGDSTWTYDKQNVVTRYSSKPVQNPMLETWIIAINGDDEQYWDCWDDRMPAAWNRPEASWKKMLLTQPPTACILMFDTSYAKKDLVHFERPRCGEIWERIQQYNSVESGLYSVADVFIRDWFKEWESNEQILRLPKA